MLQSRKKDMHTFLFITMQIYCVTWPEEPFNLLLKQQPPVVAGNTAIFTQPVESFRCC